MNQIVLFFSCCHLGSSGLNGTAAAAGNER